MWQWVSFTRKVISSSRSSRRSQLSTKICTQYEDIIQSPISVTIERMQLCNQFYWSAMFKDNQPHPFAHLSQQTVKQCLPVHLLQFLPPCPLFPMPGRLPSVDFCPAIENDSLVQLSSLSLPHGLVWVKKPSPDHLLPTKTLAGPLQSDQNISECWGTGSLSDRPNEVATAKLLAFSC